MEVGGRGPVLFDVWGTPHARIGVLFSVRCGCASGTCPTPTGFRGFAESAVEWGW